MVRRCILLGLLLFCAGCATPGDRAQWEEAMKDLRGDNMQMRSNFSSFEGTNGSPIRPIFP
jgi:hypothetical protein